MRITLNFQNGKQLAFDPKLEKDQITKVLRTENDVVSTPVRDSMSDQVINTFKEVGESRITTTLVDGAIGEIRSYILDLSESKIREDLSLNSSESLVYELRTDYRHSNI